MLKRYIYKFVVLLFLGNVYSQQTPAGPQINDFSIEGAIAHLGNGSIIENSLIMFSKGKITFVGSADEKIDRIGTVIAAKGKHVYPGFIIANSTLGLAEIDAVKASVDVDEIGQMLPHIRSIIAYNAESKVVESMRPNGILIGQVTPRGGVISGTSSIVQFDAWNWEDATVRNDEGIHLEWPNSFRAGSRRFGRAGGANKNYKDDISKIEAFIVQSIAYKNGEKSPRNLPYEAMEGLFDGSKKLYIHSSGSKEMTDAIHLVKKYGVKKVVIVHGTEAHKIADLLLEYDIPVIIERAHRRPAKEDDSYDLPYKTAALLVEKGLTVAIGMEGQMERMNSRNLPFYAGTYAAYGLPKEEALKLITSNAAKILGIDDIVGTLEVGKHATLFISEGDALDMRTNLISKAFIQGRQISLETHHTKLWKRYSKKFQGE